MSPLVVCSSSTISNQGTEGGAALTEIGSSPNLMMSRFNVVSVKPNASAEGVVSSAVDGPENLKLLVGRQVIVQREMLHHS